MSEELIKSGEASLDLAPKQSGRIPGDVVNRNTAHLNDEERSAIRWLHNHMVENDLSLDEGAALIRRTGSVLSKIYNNRYEASLGPVVAEIMSFRKLQEERNKGRKLAFVETALARDIWFLCNAAREFQRIGFIFGDTQIGKSESLIKYKEDNNHGSTIYVSMPTGGAKGLFLAELADALNISAQQQEKVLIQRIIKAIDNRMLLIVDEMHQTVMGRRTERSSKANAMNTVELIREIHDKCKCGVILCGTQVFGNEVEKGPYAGVLKQTKRRRIGTLRLPSIPTDADLNIFARQYRLNAARDEALELQTEVIRDEGLGMWLTLLRMASKIANSKKRAMSWDFVIDAHAGLRKLEKGGK